MKTLRENSMQKKAKAKSRNPALLIWTPENPRGQRGPYLYVVGIPRPGIEAVAFQYWCPGCQALHLFNRDIASPSGNLSFNLNFDSPSVVGLIKQQTPHKCWHFIKNGVLKFQNECQHALAGEDFAMTPNPAIFAELDL
jgi:hypothetical protein